MLKRFAVLAGALLIVLVAVGVSLSAVQPIVVGVDVAGNQEVVSQHILGVVGTKSGEPINSDQIQMDIETIYGLGFFSLVDVEVTQQSGGVFVEFQVQENPEVREIVFTGNTVYTSDELMELVFTQPGSIFNNVFFRHDLQRIKEKYEKDGYVLVRIEDVGFSNGVVNVKIIEPKVGEVIIQGNTKTKTEVIRRRFNLKEGDLFNATIMRHSLNKINQLGYFEDVNVGFEPSDDPSKVNIILSVEEGKTSQLAVTLGHGSNSGWSGGATWEESNYRGLGHIWMVGFETGDKERYWASYEEPYMDSEHYAWKAGLYTGKWDDLKDYTNGVYNATYDQEEEGLYYGMGKKFSNDQSLSWYALIEWSDVTVTVTDGSLPADTNLVGKNFSITGTLTRSCVDEYVSYPKGHVASLSIQQGLSALGGDWDYTKYWLEARYYWPLYYIFEDILDREIGTEDNPVILASRAMIGYSTGDMPWTEQFFVGGADNLRGYKDDEFYGDEMVLANVELRIPIKESFSLVGFYDVGMAANSSAFSDVKSGYGVGVRVKTPFGNLRVDFADGEYEQRTHFGFGEMF